MSDGAASEDAPDAGTDLAARSAQVLSETGPLARASRGFTPRAAQQGLAQAIAQAIQEQGVLVAEAGTGTGKTFAYLVPLLLSGRRVIVSTGTRHLQDQLFGRDLPAVQHMMGVAVRAALLKGRSNYVCLERLARHLSDGRFADPKIPVALRQIQRFAAQSTHGDRAECAELAETDPAWVWATATRDQCTGQACPHVKDCFVYRARREAQQADLVVVNHHLFCADLALREDDLAELLPQTDVLVFDEAHQVPEVMIEFLGESLSTRQCHDLARDLMAAGVQHAAGGAAWWQLAGHLDAAAEQVLAALGHPDGQGAERARPRTASVRLNAAQLQARPDLDALLDALQASLVAIVAAVAAHAGRGPELDQCGARAALYLERAQRWWAGLHADPDDSFEVTQAQDAAAPTTPTTQPAAVVWAEAQGTYAALRRTPWSAAATWTRCRQEGARAWILVSATLTVAGQFTHFQEALGLHDAECRRWPSPFDFARQAALWVPRGLGAPSAPGFSERMLDAVWPLLRANRGRAFILCTTVRATRLIAARLQKRDAEEGLGLTCLVQGDAPRPQLLARFGNSPAAVLVGSASFWEGVDVAGDALSLVVIDKLPFAPPDDPVLEARCAAARRAGRDPFTTEQLPAAALGLQQGVGRLIRSERDRGVLVVCDERLRTRGYGARLLASLPPFTRVDEWSDALPFLPPHAGG